MKNIKTILFLLSSILVNKCVLAQDTIVFKDKQKLVVVVKEVSPTEIQYKKIEMPDGPMYITSKNDIEKIIYKNGYVEVMKPVVAETTAGQNFTVYRSEESHTLEKITDADAKRRYGYYVTMIDRHPDLSRKEKLTNLAISIRSLKKHQDGTRTGAIIFGGVALAGGILYGALSSVNAFSYGSGDGSLFATPPIVFGTAAAILGGASIAIHINLKKKRQEFVNLYNQ